MYDAGLMGTPITSLQIPESVMQQISTDLLSTHQQSTRFTQDGKLFSELASTLSIRDFQCAAGKDFEVRRVTFVIDTFYYFQGRMGMSSMHDRVSTGITTHKSSKTIRSSVRKLIRTHSNTLRVPSVRC